MEHLRQAVSDIRSRVWLAALLGQIVVGGGCWWLYSSQVLNQLEASIAYIVASVFMSFGLAIIASRLAKRPLEALGAAIMHLAPDQAGAAAPQFDKLRVGREYVTAITYQLYQIASLQDNELLAEHRREATQATNIVNHLPLPLLVFNKEQQVTFASNSALSYLAQESAELFGKLLYEAVELEFPTDFTLEQWVIDCQKNKATDTAYWQRVRIRLKDDNKTLRQCDMAGYYNRDNPTGIEFIITLFDRSIEYAKDDKALSFVALAVHELRTPLTLMRGYIEVFEDELGANLNPELAGFMHRLQVASQQLTSFVNNILNMAHIEDNQFVVKLHEEKWEDIINHAVGDMNLRAQTADKTIVTEIDPDLPTVAADRLTMYEVLCNLIDNAIKYSKDKGRIVVKSHITNEGLVETLVQDQGVGIPQSVLPNLFEKFQRNFRNRNQVSGTGLGLYLSKVIVNAHGCSIWVKSKEGDGTTVGFTLKPYAQLANELKSGTNDDMVRTAHGWIKNHSLYRR